MSSRRLCGVPSHEHGDQKELLRAIRATSFNSWIIQKLPEWKHCISLNAVVDGQQVTIEDNNSPIDLAPYDLWRSVTIRVAGTEVLSWCFYSEESRETDGQLPRWLDRLLDEASRRVRAAYQAA